MQLEIIEIVGLLLTFVEAILLVRIFRHKGRLEGKIRGLSLFGIILVPLVMMFTANYHVFETSKTVDACMNCHVMKPMGNDMLNTESQTLAARHVTNGWIKEKQCYGCHKDYGLNGTLKAKVDGYRHLMRYITETYKEPIVFRGEFNSQNCLNCHEGKPSFESLRVHTPVKLNLTNGDGSISCMNCHGRAHPTRSQRTPGHPDYDKLMVLEVERVGEMKADSIVQWVSKLK